MSSDSNRQAWAIGGTIFGATTMIVLGFFQLAVGIAALAEDEVIVASPDYVYGVDITVWGWAHLALGAIMVLVGMAIYGMSTWARGIGIGLAALSAINNFLFLPLYPLWSIVIIALDIFVIWALATVRTPADEAAAADQRATRGRHRDADWPVNRPASGRDTDLARSPEEEAELRRTTEM